MTPLPSPSTQHLGNLHPTTPFPQILTGQPSNPTLVGHPSPPFNTPPTSPPFMALLLPPKTISRSISRLEILSSTSIGEMKLLPLTQSSLIPQPLQMAPLWLKLFCGRDTLVCDAYGIKSTKQFINTLADNIRNRGAMHTLISGGGSYEILKNVTDLLRSLLIGDYQCGPYHQHQNKA